MDFYYSTFFPTMQQIPKKEQKRFLLFIIRLVQKISTELTASHRLAFLLKINWN